MEGRFAVPGNVRRPSSLALVALLVLAACATDPDPSSTATRVRIGSASSLASAAASVDAAPSITPTPTPRPMPDEGGVYLALGDSITFGVGVPNPRRGGYVGRLSEPLALSDPPITETRVFAVPGETAAGFLERRLDDVLEAIEELGPRVELVTIGLGANELLRVRRNPTCAADPNGSACSAAASIAMNEAADALDGVIVGIQDALDAEAADARILVLAYYNPDVEPIAVATVVGSDGAVSCDPLDGAPGLNDRIACVAQRHQVELVDLYAAFLGREAELTGIGNGDVHPNAAGYQVIADVIRATLNGGPPGEGG
ncbi:hypothetical protein BH24CHL10_BH24CHL10_12410 [soil metagenome]